MAAGGSSEDTPGSDTEKTWNEWLGLVKSLLEIFSLFASMFPIVFLQHSRKILASLSPFDQVLLFLEYIFLMKLLASYSSPNRQKWYAAATIPIFLLWVFAYYDRPPPRGTCWDVFLNKGYKFSGRISFEDHIGIDRLYSNRLIEYKEMVQLRDKMTKNSWSVHDTHWLLTTLLPWKGNQQFITFCCLLLANKNLPSIGVTLCNECEAFDFRDCHINDTIHFDIDSSCQSAAFNVESVTTNPIFADVNINMKYLHEPIELNQETLSEFQVYTSTILCIKDTITATLLLSIDIKYIDREALEQYIARQLKVNRGEIEFKFAKKSSTWMLLYLSARAGLRLLETLSEREARDQFGEMIAKALVATSAKTVCIEVKISNLPPYAIYVTPTGIFSVELDDTTSLGNGNSFLIEFDMLTIGAICLLLLFRLARERFYLPSSSDTLVQNFEVTVENKFVASCNFNTDTVVQKFEDRVKDKFVALLISNTAVYNRTSVTSESNTTLGASGESVHCSTISPEDIPEDEDLHTAVDDQTSVNSESNPTPGALNEFVYRSTISHKDLPRDEDLHTETGHCNGGVHEQAATPEATHSDDAEFTPVELNKVAEKLGSHYHKIAIYLGFDGEEIAQYEEEYKTLYRILFAILDKWQKREHATRKALLDACNKAGVGEEAYRILYKAEKLQYFCSDCNSVCMGCCGAVRRH